MNEDDINGSEAKQAPPAAPLAEPLRARRRAAQPLDHQVEFRITAGGARGLAKPPRSVTGIRMPRAMVADTAETCRKLAANDR